MNKFILKSSKFTAQKDGRSHIIALPDVILGHQVNIYGINIPAPKGVEKIGILLSVPDDVENPKLLFRLASFDFCVMNGKAFFPGGKIFCNNSKIDYNHRIKQIHVKFFNENGHVLKNLVDWKIGLEITN